MGGWFTDKDKNLFQFAGGDNSTKYCLPVGTIFPSAIPLTDASVHLLDGNTISQTGVYQEFAELVKSLVSAGYNISCSQSEFDSAVSSTGNCGKFVIDNTSNTIRLPKITRFIQGLSNMIDIGDSVEAGLPNITGSLGDFRLADDNPTQSGAFKLDLGGSRSCADNTSASTSNDVFSFDASRSNSIYGNSNTVQPQATSFPYYIVLANGFVSDVKLNIDNVMNEINLKTSKDEVNINMLGVPSSRFVSISGASSGATFTPPANGYIAFKGVASSAQSQVNVVPNNDNYPAFYYVFGVASYGQAVYVPVKKGVTYNIFYDGLNQSHSWGFYIRFYYAEEV